MSRKIEIKVKLSVNSAASEADIHTHSDSILSDIIRYLEELKYKSWHKTINTGWDESYPVDIEIDTEVKEL